MDIRALQLKSCAFCGEERPVERPECLDGHGDDCPEAFCALCGLAIWGPDLEMLVAGAAPGAR